MSAKRADTVGIVGAGTFGTALGSVLARANRRVILWSRDTAVVDSILKSRRCPRLPEAPLPEPLEATADPKRLAMEARFLVLAVSSTDVRERSRELGDVLDGSHIVVHAIGALAAPSNSHSPQSASASLIGADLGRVSEVMSLGLPTLKVGCIAGPALPEDLVAGAFSSMVCASTFDEVIAEGRRLLNAPPAIRVYGSRDLAGVELASALAGAYTIALGLADGLKMGAGPRAVLITRAVAESSRLGVALGADPKTFSGLAGLGNMLVRSASSKNTDYLLGKRIADGVITADATRTEGARACAAGDTLARKHKIHMPLLSGVAAVLAGKIDPKDAAKIAGEAVASEE